MNNTIGKPEIVTQNRVIRLFKEELNYEYLGDWQIVQLKVNLKNN
jgi:hypothetical protein